MKNKRFTRVVSLVAAICLIFAIVPTASANTAGEDIVYEFANVATQIGYSSATKIVHGTYGGKTAADDTQTHGTNAQAVIEDVKRKIKDSDLNWEYVNSEITSPETNANAFAFIKAAMVVSAGLSKTNIASLTLKLTVDKAGYYEASAIIDESTILRKAATAYLKIYKDANTKEAVLLTDLTDELSAAAMDLSGDVTRNMGCAYLDAGEYYLDVYVKNSTTNSQSNMNLENITLTPLNGDVFAEKYAVIEKNNTDNYDVHFFGGLKSIDYKAVGFEVTIGGVAQSDITTTNVYEQIRVSVDGSATDITAADFGTGSEYIYYATLEDVVAGSEIVIAPYVLDGNDNKIYYGKTFTYTVAAA